MVAAEFVTTTDGTEIFYKDWGAGRPVVLSHGWPLNSDSWEAQQLFLAGNGYRVIAHDRRGHGRSTQTWHGNDMDTYAEMNAAYLAVIGDDPPARITVGRAALALGAAVEIDAVAYVAPA